MRLASLSRGFVIAAARNTAAFFCGFPITPEHVLLRAAVSPSLRLAHPAALDLLL
jgi:hypothetical protein